MIFDQIFRPRHQHPDPQKRIIAVASLAPQEESNRAVLRDLAFNDGDAEVAWSALQRLDDLALLIKAMQTASHDSVRARARAAVVEQFCIPESSNESESKLKTFLVELTDKELQAELLFSSPLATGSAELTLQIMKRLDKPAVERQLFRYSSHDDVLLHIVEKQTTSKQLKSLKREQVPAVVADAITAKIAKCERIDTFVSSAQDEIKLQLSKLKYLATAQDYRRIKRQHAEIREAFSGWFEQYQEARSMFKQHQLVQLEEAIERFHQLAERVNAQEHEQYQEWVRVQHINEITERLTTCTDQVNYCASQCEHFYLEVRSAVQWQCEFTASQKVLDTALTEQLHALNEIGSKLVTTAQRQMHESLQQRINDLQAELNNAQAQLATENQVGNTTKEIELSRVAGTNVDSETTVDNQMRDAESAVSGQKATVDGIDKTVIKSLRKVRYLIDRGQYRAAIYRFDSLPKEAMTVGIYAAVAEKIEELKSLQDFIGIPRKQELLSEAATLVSLPMTTVADRAAEVKRLRKEWTSLGNTTDSNDAHWNAEFNEHLEQAFAPCRQAYELAEQERSKNKQRREELLQQLHILEQQSVEVDKKTIKRFFQLQQEWRECGSVDIAVREQLQGEYQSLVDSIKERINQFWAANRQAKKDLVAKAQSLNEVDIHVAIDEAKALQAQWKLVGPCARKHEQSLWRTFDQAIQLQFTRLSEQRMAKQQQALQHYHDLEQQRAMLVEQVDAAVTRAELVTIESSLKTLDEEMASLAIEKQKNLSVSLETLRRDINAKHTELLKEKRIAEVHRLLAGIEPGECNSDSHQTAEGSQKQPHYSEIALTGQQSRLEQTILIELETGVQPLDAACEEESQLRRDIQLERMRRRLERGEQALELEQLVQQWAAFGPVTEPEKPLFQRLKRAVLSAV